jgi:predicted Zn-dependent protease with MMP-like domain
MQREVFKQLVAEALDSISPVYRERIKNVAIIVEDEPSKAVLRKNGLQDGWTLLGLYEGIPLTERGDYYGVGETLPDRITIFQGPIEDEAGGDPEKIRQSVKETVEHEIGHYFGMDEHTVRNRERARRTKNKEQRSLRLLPL